MGHCLARLRSPSLSVYSPTAVASDKFLADLAVDLDAATTESSADDDDQLPDNPAVVHVT